MWMPSSRYSIDSGRPYSLIREISEPWSRAELSSQANAQALAAVSEAVPAPAGDELARVVAQLRLGAGAGQAWAPLLAVESTAPLARAVQRSSETGAPLAQALTRVADDLRARRRGELLAAARVAGVTAVLPLGLCFLPAFALLGVVPVVVSLVVEVVAL